jgi:hypothetical protein
MGDSSLKGKDVKYVHAGSLRFSSLYFSIDKSQCFVKVVSVLIQRGGDTYRMWFGLLILSMLWFVGRAVRDNSVSSPQYRSYLGPFLIKETIG